MFTGGADPLPHLNALKVGLFLSSEETAVNDALADGLSAGLIHGDRNSRGNWMVLRLSPSTAMPFFFGPIG